MENKVAYEQLEKANSEIKTTDIRGKGYAQVNERVNAYRKVYPTGSIETEIQEIKDDYVRMRTIVTDENDKIIATGTASETNTGKNQINITSMLENCETSAVGRALGFAGFGIDKAVASSEDIARNKYQSKRYEIYDNMFISDDEAKNIVKAVVMDLMRKMGVVKAELEEHVDKKLWSSLSELTTRQLINIEYILKGINMEDNEWHDLYNKNIKIKNVVEKGQAVVYETSHYKFGKLALEQAGTNELLRNEIINSYLDMGIDLQGE